MKVKLKLENNNNCNKENVIVTLPTNDETITRELDRLIDCTYDEILVTEYKSPMNIDFSIYEGTDLYDVNKSIEKLNQVVTDDEIIALSEIYNNLDDVVSRAQRGTYEFYPNQTLKNVAYRLANTERYKYYRNSDGDVDDSAIVDDLCKLGYEQTSMGVILMK